MMHKKPLEMKNERVKHFFGIISASQPVALLCLSGFSAHARWKVISFRETGTLKISVSNEFHRLLILLL